MPQNRKNTGDITDQLQILGICKAHLQQMKNSLTQQYGNDSFAQITDQGQGCTALSKTTQCIRQSGIMAAVISNIFLLNQFSYNNRRITAAQQVGNDSCQENCNDKHTPVLPSDWL